MEEALRSRAEDGDRGALYVPVRLPCETSRMQEAQRVAQGTGPDGQYAHQMVAGGLVVGVRLWLPEGGCRCRPR